MGKYYDDVGSHSRAFASFQRANQLHKLAAEPYNRGARTAFVDDMIRGYTREALAQREEGASDSTRPVFVVGMMRSGTSLVEQIIASHPLAYGAGELPFWNDAAEQFIPPRALDGFARKRLAEKYLAVLARHSQSAQRVIDKSTFNSDYLGPIHSVFPNARMIYVRRHPIDACLSAYFQPFSTAFNFTMDLSDLAHYCREHCRLVAHWRNALPAGVLLEVPYEELVADQERWTRRILDFVGLEWNARCLEFHKTQRLVLTASNWQVRQRVYRSSVERWRNYQKFIAPLLELKDLPA